MGTEGYPGEKKGKTGNSQEYPNGHRREDPKSLASVDGGKKETERGGVSEALVKGYLAKMFLHEGSRKAEGGLFRTTDKDGNSSNANRSTDGVNSGEGVYLSEQGSSLTKKKRSRNAGTGGS